MKKETCALVALLVAGAASAATITAEAGLDLVNSETLANEAFTAEDGAVIRVVGADAARPGLTFHKSNRQDTLAQVKRPHDPVTGDSYDARTNLIFDSALSNAAPAGTWIHQGRWYAPTTGLYSFAAAFDDRLGLLIDGCPVLTAEWSKLNAVTDVPLAQGWHDLEITFVNEKSNMGTPSGFAKGLVWSADNQVFTQDNIGDGNLFCDPGDGSSLQQVHNGTFCRQLDIPSGTVTLDLTQSALTGPFCFGNLTGLRTGPGAKLLVRGATNLVFYGADNGGVHHALLDADIEFADDPEGRVRIVGKASIERMRPNYVIEDGSEVAYWGTNMITVAEWTLTNRNAQLISDAAVSSDTKIRVADGSILTIKPCRHNPSNTWNWQGTQGAFANDFELAGSQAYLTLRTYRDLTLSGRLSGNGTLTAVDTTSDGPARLTGDLSAFAGTYRVYDGGQLSVEGVLPEVGVATVGLGNVGSNGGRISFRPEGAGVAETAVAIGRTWGKVEDAFVEAVTNQEITIGTFGGIGGVKTANLSNSHITVESLDADATLVLRYMANVTVKSVGAGARIKVVGMAEEHGLLELGQDVGTLDLLEVVDGAPLTLTGTGTVLRVTGSGTISVGKGITIQRAEPGIDIRYAAGQVIHDTDSAVLASALGSTPALWLDASRPDTMQQYLNCVFTNGMVIRRWNDCRASQTGLYGINPRGEGYVRVYPYVMTNALNGMDVVSMGAVGGQLSDVKYGHIIPATGEPADAEGTAQPETRRLPFNQPIRVRTAIIVFGSQFGGGGAILGGDKDQGVKDLQGSETSEWSATPNTTCAFARGSTDSNAFKIPETAIFKTTRNCWLDGEAVDPTTMGYNGGWQIVSFESQTEAGEEVRSLGMIESYSNSGGQNYAEVLLYTNALTSAERHAVELHLARKWGLWGSMPVNGSGQMVISDVYPAEGTFAGTVAVQTGGCLNLGAAPLPMTEAEMPSEGRIGWFDPDFAASVEVAGASEPGREDTVYGIFDRGSERVNGTPYLHGTYNSTSSGGSGDRCPRVLRGVRGDAPERTWINFFEDPSDGGGNTLRVKTDPSLLRKNNPPDYSNTTLQMRTAFIACDSMYGGGNPIADNVSVSGLVKRRVVDNAISRIWAGGTTGSITNGETRLNGRRVDGTKTGFTGAPEVLSFTTTNAFPAAYFGSCGTGASTYQSEKSFEVLGEIVLFDRVIEGEERARIEAYLMNKWTGRLPAGWCDWRRATVTGAGLIKAPTKEVLPTFANEFAGQIDLAGKLAFHVDATNVVTDALTLPSAATLTLPEKGTLSVSFAGNPSSCELATAGTIDGFNVADWTLLVSPTPKGTYRLVCTDGVLRLEVLPTGTMFLVR